MSWTYNGPAFSDKDKVRLKIGDTTSSDQLLTDEEIQFFLDNNNGNIRAASIEACRSLISKFAKLTSKTTGKVSVQYSDITKHYRLLLEDLINEGKPAATIFSGGISQEAFFKRNMMENA